MKDNQFWARSPIYIVICVLLGFVIAGLLAQNNQLKTDLTDVKREQQQAQVKAEDLEKQTTRVINYLRCISLTPVGERTAELVDKCLSEDLPAQPKAEGSTGGTSFLEPAGTSSQSNNGSSNSVSPSNPITQVPNSNNGPNNGITDDGQQNENGVIPLLTNPLCVNLTPRICATLGL